MRSSHTPTEAPVDTSRGYETRDVNLRALVWFAAIIAALIVGSLIGLRLLWNFYQQRFAGVQTRDNALVEQDQIPPPPRLQNTPTRDYEDFRLEQEAELKRYRWIDREGGVVQIPIERAMELALERGVGSPSREKTNQPDKANPRKTPDPLAPSNEEGSP